jgi:hypothetical protein
MAHVGQKRALGTICGFGGFFGLLQLLLGLLKFGDVVVDGERASIWIFHIDRCG